MIALFDRLSGRRQQRTGHALDTLASAARDAAAGRTVDVAAVDDALHELHQPVEYFKELCDVAEKRRVAGLALEKLGVASGKQRKLAEAIEAEVRRYEEIRNSHTAKLSALEADKAAADRLVAEANRARETLLRPDHIIGSARERYEDAIADRDIAIEEVSRLRRELKQQADKAVEADRWIASIRHLHEKDLAEAGPYKAMKPNDREAREIEPHETAKARAKQRVAEIEPQLREAEQRLDRAERSVVAIEVEILKQ